MRSYFATGCCGINPRIGSIMAGVYMIMVCIMQVVFNRGNLRDAQQRLANSTAKLPSHMKWLLDIIPALYYLVYFLLTITFFMSLFLLLSIYKQFYRGLLIYVGWIILYEIINTVLLTTTEILMKKGSSYVRATEWFGYSIRIVLHFFWLTFIVSYAFELANFSGKPLFSIRRLSRLSRSKQKASKTPPTLKFTVQQEA